MGDVRGRRVCVRVCVCVRTHCAVVRGGSDRYTVATVRQYPCTDAAQTPLFVDDLGQSLRIKRLRRGLDARP